MTIEPIVDTAPNPAALDTTGQSLHCVWRFPANQSIEFPSIREGLRHLPQWSPNAQDFYIESNPGSFRIPHGWSLYFGGGAPDSRWWVTITHEQDFNGSGPATYALDTIIVPGAPAPVPVIRPAYHYEIEAIAGPLLVSGAIPVLPAAKPLSLSAPDIAAPGGTIYRTLTKL